MDEPIDVSQMRINYEKSELHEDMVAPTPLDQFNRWLHDCVSLGSDVMPEPNAMVLSTADADGNVHARTVLLKRIDARGLIFFTNYNSAKARDITENPRISAAFPWYPLHRQVIVTGTVSKIAEQESAEYFATRPYKSQLGALVSSQSSVIENRGVLEHELEQLEQQYPEGSTVPMPEHWGGYLIKVDTMEFWQGRRSRLHDRLRYDSTGNGDITDSRQWRIVRLSP